MTQFHKKGSLGLLLMAFIALAVGAILMSNVFMSTVKSTNVSGWSPAETVLWGTIGLVSIAGFVYAIAAVFGMV